MIKTWSLHVTSTPPDSDFACMTKVEAPSYLREVFLQKISNAGDVNGHCSSGVEPKGSVRTIQVDAGNPVFKQQAPFVLLIDVDDQASFLVKRVYYATANVLPAPVAELIAEIEELDEVGLIVDILKAVYEPVTEQAPASGQSENQAAE